ncbi:MAG: 50S ribosomal protein L30e [Candidatus Diapherotrites archaeon CG11_big_fil_rev_8_21_14_0_20_37_9]|nr:MAG: 50S ribosomal protein L30e [Candidatus Diapherotrites archaeon CG11_big_fil_rev_8_21_14_0_20_37_9]
MAEIDAAKEIRRATDTGKVIFGTKESENSIKNGSSKVIIISNNTPQLVREKMVSLSGITGTPPFLYQGSALDLGSVCGKPFPVSVMVVTDEGKSKVLDLVKQ